MGENDSSSARNVVFLSKTPLGIIALFILLSESLPTIIFYTGSLSSDQKTLSLVLIFLLPVAILISFVLILIFRPEAVIRFDNDKTSIEAIKIFAGKSKEIDKDIESLSEKVLNITKAIYSQPMYKYVKLSASGKQLILTVKNG